MPKVRNALTNYARTTRTVISWLAGILVIIFGWLEFRDIQIGQIVGSVSGDLLVKIALCIYYLSWVAGTINDVDEQETAYAEAPSQGKVPWKGIVVAVVVAAVFALLCYVNSAKIFSLVLAGFLVINVLGYLYILAIISPTITKSRTQYVEQGDHCSLIKLEIVWKYMGGKWQWYRFAFGFAAIGVVMAASFSRLPQLLNSVYPAIPTENYLALSVLLYVITFEGWIWAMRIWAKVAQGTVDFIIDRCPQGLKPGGS